MGFLVRVIINGVAIWLTTLILRPGFDVVTSETSGDTTWKRVVAFLVVGLIFGLVNAIIAGGANLVHVSEPAGFVLLLAGVVGVLAARRSGGASGVLPLSQAAKCAEARCASKASASAYRSKSTNTCGWPGSRNTW